MNQIYLDTARLLTQVAPLVFVDNTFALKGGTAINLFVRDMPRLSVDLDLVFPDHTLSRDAARQADGGNGSAAPARERMAREIQQGFDDNERRFLLSLLAGTPEWSLLGIAHLEQLPGIRWKLHNLAQLQKTDAKKFAEQTDLLATRMSASS